MWNASKSKNMTEDADSTGQNDGACDMCWFFSREVSEKLNVARAGGAAVVTERLDGREGWGEGYRPERAGLDRLGLDSAGSTPKALRRVWPPLCLRIFTVEGWRRWKPCARDGTGGNGMCHC